MMQNIRFFNVCEARRATWRHLKANGLHYGLHYPVQAKRLNFYPYIDILYYQLNIYLIIFHSNMLVILVK